VFTVDNIVQPWGSRSPCPYLVLLAAARRDGRLPKIGQREPAGGARSKRSTNNPEMRTDLASWVEAIEGS
jgi:hypothetical protein